MIRSAGFAIAAVLTCSIWQGIRTLHRRQRLRQPRNRVDGSDERLGQRRPPDGRRAARTGSTRPRSSRLWCGPSSPLGEPYPFGKACGFLSRSADPAPRFARIVPKQVGKVLLTISLQIFLEREKGDLSGKECSCVLCDLDRCPHFADSGRNAASGPDRTIAARALGLTTGSPFFISTIG
jgi:hypothetical protein